MRSKDIIPAAESDTEDRVVADDTQVDRSCEIERSAAQLPPEKPSLLGSESCRRLDSNCDAAARVTTTRISAAGSLSSKFLLLPPHRRRPGECDERDARDGGGDVDHHVTSFCIGVVHRSRRR